VDYVTLGIAITSFILISFTKIDPTFVIIGAGVLGAFFL
jgi:small-conductance mechanosensitive channel